MASDQPPVFSVNQQGGITAHTVNVNQAPQPNLRVDGASAPERLDSGGYRARFALRLENADAARNLYVAGLAPSVIGADLRPAAGGAMMNHASGTARGTAFSSFDNPPERLVFDVVTKNPEPRIDFGWRYS
jgi:hypothetical protein